MMMRRFLAARLDRRTELGLALTVSLAVIALLLWGFIALAEAFPQRGALDRFDINVEAWLQAHGSENGERVFLIVSLLGAPVLAAGDITVAIVLAVRRAWLRLVLWVGAVVGASVLDALLKAAYHRQRPIYATEFVHDRSWSFPSGHAMFSFVSYAVLAYLLLEQPRSRTVRRAMIAGAILLIVAIGFSRLYLGVHYASDVVAGYLAGGAWATACIIAYRIVRQRRTPSALV
jgi:membrane-associated phospholipid phosphatase